MDQEQQGSVEKGNTITNEQAAKKGLVLIEGHILNPNDPNDRQVIEDAAARYADWM